MDKKSPHYLAGLGAGLINGLLGSGGGLVLVPIFKRCGLDSKHAQATSVAVIAAISVVSVIVYAIKGTFTQGGIWGYLLGGAIGGALGSFLLKKLPDKWLRRAFGAFALYAAVRMFTS
ncbi:MAG: sulfite exporter TauE/SafE family protein [Ruminococcaceae bacterium]|nr:sulfite exporter TauE/SafE family protein [Oscillospiraceae bacterium]